MVTLVAAAAKFFCAVSYTHARTHAPDTCSVAVRTYNRSFAVAATPPLLYHTAHARTDNFVRSRHAHALT